MATKDGMAVKRLSLNGSWRLRGGGPDGADIEVPATVPGVVHMDLQRAGIIDDPFIADNELAAEWVALRDWTYSRSWRVSKGQASAPHIELVFEGLDTFAEITLNGQPLGRTENMFVTHRFDVAGRVRQGENTIDVKFLSPVAEGLRLHRRHREVTLHEADGNPRPYVRKAQYSFGWDWGPRLATSGLWRDVYLESWHGGRIESVFWRTLKLSKKAAQVEVSIDCRGDGSLEAEASLSVGGSAFDVKLARSRSDGGARFSGKVTLKDPALWWPVGHGRQNLYKAKVVLKSGGAEIDAHKCDFGVRTVELRRPRERDGEGFRIAINGHEIFCKGANWIPADSYLPRLSRRDYSEWVAEAAGANMNMLRVWGGGIYEGADFYRACDRAGVMVWQDFPFACAMYPEGKWFLKNVEHEARLAVKALRNHPSLVLWCGNNENHWAAHSWWPDEPFGGKTIYDRLLPEITAELDPSRPYWPGSPWGGRDPNSETRGDRHAWQVWSGWSDYREYLSDEGGFLSEFGFQAPPPMEAVADFGPGEKLHPQHPLFEHHNKQVGGPERLARFLAAVFPPPRDLEGFVHLTQLVQAEAIRMGVLHWRSRQMETAGALYWQLNDCWPVCSWSASDHMRRPKALWYYSRRFFAPVALRTEELADGISAWLINDSPSPADGALTLSAIDFDGAVKGEITQGVRAAPGGVVHLGPLKRAELGIEDPSCVFIAASLKASRKGIVRDTAFLLRPKHLRLGDPGLKWKVTGTGGALAVEITAKRLAYGVYLRIPGVEARFGDNFMTILPGETVKVSISGTELKAREAARRVVVRWAPGGLE